MKQATKIHKYYKKWYIYFIVSLSKSIIILPENKI